MNIFTPVKSFVSDIYANVYIKIHAYSGWLYFHITLAKLLDIYFNTASMFQQMHSYWTIRSVICFLSGQVETYIFIFKSFTAIAWAQEHSDVYEIYIFI